MYVDLTDVRKEWLSPRGRGLQQLRTSGLHCNVYQDVFGCDFWPRDILEVCYQDSHLVTWGDVLQAKLALSQPRVTLPQNMAGKYATLLFTNPDGHLQDHMKEVLHWMV